MIKVQVPRVSEEDVARMRASMDALAATVRTYAPIWATLMAQMSQQMTVAAKAFRASLEQEIREREEARHAGE